MSYELAPIQLPTLETCKRLQELGVLPPKDCTTVHIYKAGVNGGHFNTTAFFDNSGACNWDVGNKIVYIDAIFAPTLDQIRKLLDKAELESPKIQAISSFFSGGFYRYWCKYNTANSDQPKETPTIMEANEAEAAAQLLIHLIENQLL